MIECVDQINSILDLLIKVSIIIGIGFLVYFFIKLKFLDSEIERKDKKFEKERDDIVESARGRGITTEILNRQVEKLEKDKNKHVAPLERERQRIISKIPFLK